MSGAPELAAEVARWRRDPVHFARTMLGVTSLWERQVEILHALRDHRRVAVPSCHESGKALALDTPLPTPSGWTTMGAVTVGDELLDETGRAVRVTATSPVHERPCYRVLFSDGSAIVASDDHRWAVLDRDAPEASGWDDTRIVTTTGLAAAGAPSWRLPAWSRCAAGATIRSITAAGTRRVKCVAVDGPRHLYLAGRGMIPTHNTFVASVAAVHHLMAYQPSKVITTAPSQRQVKELLWTEIRSRHAGMIRTLGADPGLGTPNLTDWQVEADWFATGFATSPDKASENASRLHGYHSPHLLVILDEAGGIAREVWSAIDGLLTSGTARVLAIGNPASGTEFERVCRSPDWRVLRISAFDCPNLRGDGPAQPWGVTRQWVDEMRRRWGEGSAVFQTKVLGLFPESSVDTLLSIAEVEQALARIPGGVFPKELLVSIGVDVARFGSDETVLYVLRGNTVLASESWAGQDTMKTAGRVIALALEHGLWKTQGHRIAVDDTGVGGGVVDRLRELGWGVQAVNFGSAPRSSTNEVRFLNRRTELWWDLREWIRTDAALGSLPPDTQDALRADLCAPKYEQRSDGRIALEPKDRVRSRVGRSPDHGDALALALAPVTSVPAWPWLVPKRTDDDDRHPGERGDRRDRRPSAREQIDTMLSGIYGPGILRRPFE